MQTYLFRQIIRAEDGGWGGGAFALGAFFASAGAVSGGDGEALALAPSSLAAPFFFLSILGLADSRKPGEICPGRATVRRRRRREMPGRPAFWCGPVPRKPAQL
jgi:hypothetical protein